MTWQRVAALELLDGGAIAAAAFHKDVIASTLADAAAGFAINRDPDRNGSSSRTIYLAHGRASEGMSPRVQPCRSSGVRTWVAG
jgi:hypothetical protein